MTVDLTQHAESIDKEEAQILVNFIANYTTAEDESLAKAFKSYGEYKKFVGIAEKLGLADKLNMVALKISVQRKFPILILIDVGGSILYRSGDKLDGVVRNRSTFY